MPRQLFYIIMLAARNATNAMNLNSNLANNTFSADRDENLLNDNCTLVGKETTLVWAAKITAFAVVIATSLIGNILVIAVTRNTQRMKKLAFTFVVNMAIADLCTTVINMPESLYVEIRNTDEWIPGYIGVLLCKLLPFCQQVCSCCSVLSLLAIAFDRFCAICFPLKKVMTRKLSKVVIASTWLIPCLSSAPMLVTNNVIEIEELHFCLEEWLAPFDPLNSPEHYTIALFVLFYILPLCITSVFYGFVIHKIWKRKIVGNHSSKTKRLHSRSRRKSLKMFIAIVVCFMLCWLPNHVAYFLIHNDEEFRNCGLPRYVDFISLFFSHAISALNPCIYIIFNQDYRSGAKQLIITWSGELFCCKTIRAKCSCNVLMHRCDRNREQRLDVALLKTYTPTNTRAKRVRTGDCKSSV